MSKKLKKSKVEAGETFIVHGFSVLEVSTVVSVDNRTAILANGIKFKLKTLEPVNSKFQLMRYDEDTYEVMKVNFHIVKTLDRLTQYIRSGKSTSEQNMSLYKRISKLFPEVI